MYMSLYPLFFSSCRADRYGNGPHFTAGQFDSAGDRPDGFYAEHCRRWKQQQKDRYASYHQYKDLCGWDTGLCL